MLLELLLGVVIGLLLLCAGLLGWLLRRSGHDALLRVTARLEALRESQERITRAVVDEIGFGRREAAQALEEQRGQLTRALHELRDVLLEALAGEAELGKRQLAEQRELLEARYRRSEALEQQLLQCVRQEVRGAQEATATLLGEQRLELEEQVAAALREARDALGAISRELAGWLESADARLAAAGAQAALETERPHAELARALEALRSSFEESSSRLSEAQARERGALATSVENALGSFQDDHARRLERIRHAVEERLPVTFDQRMAESLRPASARLDDLRRALDELRALAARTGSLLS